MMIKTRVCHLRDSLEYPKSWANVLADKNLNPSQTLYITTEIPASDMTIKELLELIEEKKEQAVIRKALAQYYEAIDILKAFGAEIESEVTGLEKLEWLQDEGE